MKRIRASAGRTSAREASASTADGMKVLLTGATGFLGQELVRQLLAAGHQVRATVRRPAPGLAALGVETVQASLLEPDSLQPHFAGIEAVIHAAGGGKVVKIADMYTQNTDTTAGLVKAARRAEIGTFILISSLAARGPDGLGHPVSHYGRSKLLAEGIALRQQQFPVTILRPPGIYGPGDTRFGMLFRQVQRGIVPVPAPKDALSLVWGPDCATAVIRMLAHPPAHGRIYTVADGGIWSSEQILDLIASALGHRPLKLPVPMALLSGLAGASFAWGQLSGKPGFLTPDKIRDLAQARWTCDSGPIHRDLGWEATVRLPEGIERMAREGARN